MTLLICMNMLVENEAKFFVVGETILAIEYIHKYS